MSSSRKNKVVYQEFASSKESNPEENQIPELSPSQQNLKIHTSKSGRKGKTVSIITGFQCSSENLSKLLKQLKTKCGSGGTIKDNAIEIQGDHRQKLLAILKGLNYKVKVI